MIVGNTASSQASHIYSKLSSNNPKVGAVQSTLKSSYDADMDMIISRVGQKQPSSEKQKGIVTGAEKKPASAEQQQMKQGEINDKLTVSKMVQVERSVTAHEQAHKTAAGQYAGPISYDYATGPDGKRYVVSGEVPINAPQGRTPEDTIQIMERVKRAALAPADPSAQDVAVAAQAAQQQQMARNELNKESINSAEGDYSTSFPLKGKITQISDYNPYSQPVTSDVDDEEPIEVKNKEKTGALESLKKSRKVQIREASRDMANRTISVVDQNTDNKGHNLVSFEKLKALIQEQRNYSGRMFRILDIVA